MKKQLRTLQPAHRGSPFTIAQAVRAFRQVRGSAAKPEVFDDEQVTPVVRRASRSAPPPTVADSAAVANEAARKRGSRER